MPALGFAQAQDDPTPPEQHSDTEPGEDDDELAQDPQADDEDAGAVDEELDEYRVEGRRVYLICIYGPRDDGAVPRKCAQMEAELNRAYGARWVTRLNNPTEEQLERIHERVGQDIAVVIVVTHSTPDDEEDSGFDVWDCDLDPDDFADIFDDQWVIWNGCYSRSICELADNILPTQCEDGVLSESDDTWRDVVRCLEQAGDDPYDRDDICREVFRRDWVVDEDD